MKIAVIGTGRMGKTLGRLWSEQGYEIMFGSRELATAQAAAAELGCLGGTIRDSAEWCDTALLAIPWYAFTDIERAVETGLDGKVVIDCMNPLRSTGSLAIGHKWSAGEEVAKVFHRADVVKAFNHLYSTILVTPQVGGQTVSAFYCSNSDRAKEVVVELIRALGFAPVDSGPIKHSRYLEPLAAFWMQLAFTMHKGTSFAINVVED